MKSLTNLFVLLLLLSASAEAGAADESYEKAFRLFKGRDYRNAVVHFEQYIAHRPETLISAGA